MKALFVLATLVLLLTGCASTSTPSTSTSTETKPCADRGDLATFGVDGRNEDYLRSCFPCCFCCEGPGTCCDSCKDNNKLTSKKAPSKG